MERCLLLTAHRAQKPVHGDEGGTLGITAMPAQRSAALSMVGALLAKDATAVRSPEEQLWSAALLGDLTTARRLLTDGADCNGFCDRFGCTPLMIAARGGRKLSGLDLTPSDCTTTAPTHSSLPQTDPPYHQQITG